MRRLLLSILALLLAPSPIFVSNSASGKLASDPPAVAPEAVGISSSRLAHIRAVMNRHVAENRIPGASGLILRRGKIAYQETFGMADIEAGKPMRMDTIHRIYSMSKPITSVAVIGNALRASGFCAKVL